MWSFVIPNEETQHKVTLTQPFYMQTTEVTQGQWEKLMGSNPSHFSTCGEDCPVENVTWNDVQSYITMLNARGEGTYSLPTEAQWEYACRAGSTTAFYNGVITDPENADQNLDIIGRYAWNSRTFIGHYYDDGTPAYDGPRSTWRVGQKEANAWGLYDMSGNVSEWCQDWFGQIAVTRRCRVDIGAICNRVICAVKKLCLVQQPPCTTGHCDGLLVRPAIAWRGDPHPVQPKVPHRAGSGPNVFAHLRADQDESGLRAIGWHLASSWHLSPDTLHPAFVQAVRACQKMQSR